MKKNLKDNQIIYQPYQGRKWSQFIETTTPYNKQYVGYAKRTTPPIAVYVFLVW